MNLSVALLTVGRERGEKMRSAEEFDNVQRLIAAGLNDCAIARETRYPTSHDMRHEAPANSSTKDFRYVTLRP
jgi:hypothetical protein